MHTLEAKRIPYEQLILADRPVAYWPLDETVGTRARDISGNNLHGTYINTPVQSVNGPVFPFNCLRTVPPSSYVEVANNALLQIIGDLTLEYWIFSDDNLRVTPITKTANREFEWTLEIDVTGFGRAPNFYQGNATDGAVNAGGSASATNNGVKNGVWEHVVGVRVAATRTITHYINGRFNNSGAYGGVNPIQNSTFPVRIGTNSTGNQNVNGRLAHVVIYNYALTATQARLHYERGNLIPFFRRAKKFTS